MTDVQVASPDAGQIEALRAQIILLKQKVAEAEEWKDVLVADAHTYADEHELCEAFDDFMKEHGLPTRKKEWEVEVKVTSTVNVRLTVKASTASDAMDRERMETMELARLITRADPYDIYIESVEALEAERAY